MRNSLAPQGDSILQSTYGNPDPLERFEEQLECNHRDDYGSMIIIGEHYGDYPVCMECGMRFPELPKREDRLDG